MNALFWATLAVSSLLALTIGYAFWVKLRVLWFKADLLDMLSDLHAEAVRTGATDDPAYREIRDIFESLYSRMEYVSVPLFIFAFMLDAKKNSPSKESPETENVQFKPVVDRIRQRFVHRFWRYLRNESLTGVILHLIVSSLPKSAVRDEAKHAADISAKAIGSIAAAPS